MLKAIPKEYHDSSKGTLKLLWEDEWRSMGITQVCDALKRAGHTKLWGRDRRQGHGKRTAGANPPFLQSLGWEHYEVHEPEPHILLFKYVRLGTPSQPLPRKLPLLRLCAFGPGPGAQPANLGDRRPLNYQPPAQ